MAVIVASAVVITCASASVDELHFWRSAKWSVISAGIVAATLALQKLVATRARPALAGHVKEADDLLRSLASTQGFARPAIALALFSCSNSLVVDQNPRVALARFAFMVAGIVWWSSAIVESRGHKGTFIAPLARTNDAPASTLSWPTQPPPMSLPHASSDRLRPGSRGAPGPLDRRLRLQTAVLKCVETMTVRVSCV